MPDGQGRMRLRGFNGALAVLAAGIGLAMLAVLAAVLLVWNERRAQIRDWQVTAANLSTTVAAHAEQTIKAADLVLQSIVLMARQSGATDPEAFRQAMATPAVFESLRDKVGGVPQVDVASIVSATGDIINYSRAFPPPPVNLADRDFIAAATMPGPDGVFLGRPVFGRAGGGHLFFLARPVLDPSGRPLGAAVVGISIQFFERFYQAARLGAFSTVSLYRDDGVLLARDPASGDAGPEDDAWAAAKRAGRPNPASLGRVVEGPDGDVRVVASRPVSSFPVMGSITVGGHVVLAKWRRDALVILSLAGGGVLVVVAMALLLARQFRHQARMLQQLTQARHAAEDAVAAQTAQSRLLGVTLDNINQGMMMVAADHTVPVCNRRAAELLDLPSSLIESRPTFEQIVQYQRSIGEFPPVPPMGSYTPGLARMLREPTTYERRRPNGRILEIQTIPLPDGGMVRTFTDITERRRSEEQVRYFARHDPLTRLVNRMVFQERLEDAIQLADHSRRRLAVLYLDLDGFKPINDTHGHATGDRLLIEVAARLCRVVREIDTVARMGGDEFAIIQPLIDRHDAAEQLARRVLAAVREPFQIGDVQCTVGLSIGIAFYPDHALTVEGLLHAADMALYRAKADGKGGYSLFDEFMDRRRQSEFQLEQALKQALPDGQLTLEYQPIVDAATGIPARYEALLRWRHPTRGLINPAEFIGAAERSGLIVPIGQWVLQTACTEAMRWPPAMGLTVNISPLQFTRDDLPDMVEDVLHRTGLAPTRLALEVTEGVLLEETGPVLGAMQRLRATGVQFCLDDFGTAHSGLTYLRKFPFDVIKIDKSFVQDAVHQEEARAIVGAIVAIGTAFRLDVIAEGVETEEQRTLVRTMGCTQLQGFLTGRPAPPGALPAAPLPERHEIA